MKERSDLYLFIKYVSLNVFSMIGLSCYILADTYFVANGIGEDGLTALNLAIPVYNFINGIGLMLGIGGAAKFSIYRVQGKKEDGSGVFVGMLIFSVFFSVFFLLLGAVGAFPLARLLGADEKTLEMTGIYLRMILIFSPAFITNNILNAFVKNDGNPQLSMIAMFSGCMFNILFDYLFIYPLRLGIFGAVLATGFAPVVGMLILSLHFLRKKNSFFLTRATGSLRSASSAVAIGIPSFITEASSGLVIIIYNLLILKLAGNTGVAAYGIIANIALVVLAIYTGIAQGMQPILSEKYGRGEKKGLRNIFFYGILTVFFVSFALYLGLFLKADPIAALFNRDKNTELQLIAVSGIHWYFTGILFAGLNILLSIYFASMEKAVPAQMISLLRGFILVIPVVCILAKTLHLQGIWISFPITEGITLFAAILLLRKHIKQ